jgi:ribonucleoside-diphosphate reductase subunit M2
MNQKYYAKLKLQEKSNPLLNGIKDRIAVFPILFPRLQKAFKNHQSAIWSSEELDIKADRNSWKSLSEPIRQYLENILSYFAVADNIVVENLTENFQKEVKLQEAVRFYSLQNFIEHIHIETYSSLITNLITDKKKQKKLLEGQGLSKKSINNKIMFAKKWMDQSLPFVVRLIAFICIEGIFFSSSFAAFHWICSLGYLTHGFKKSNEFISRDEGLHVHFGLLEYHEFFGDLDVSIIQNIVQDAVRCELEFIDESLKHDLKLLSKNDLKDHVRYTANTVLENLNVPQIYKSKNDKIISASPFNFNVKSALNQKFNFFETNPTYIKNSSNFTESIDKLISDDGKDDF